MKAGFHIVHDGLGGAAVISADGHNLGYFTTVELAERSVAFWGGEPLPQSEPLSPDFPCLTPAQAECFERRYLAPPSRHYREAEAV